MIINANKLTHEYQTQQYDFCIVGAGAAGLYLLKSLTESGKRVCLLEAGDKICTTDVDIGFSSLFTGNKYSGATVGRAFGLGGTTALWGGQLLPYSKYDIREHTKFTDSWIHIVKQISKYSQSVYSKLHLKQDIDFSVFPKNMLGDQYKLLENSQIAVLASDWLPFKQRNFHFFIDSNHLKSSNIDIYTNAVTSKWEVKKKNAFEPQVTSVLIKTSNGKKFEICANEFIITAGAIESPRILLEIFSENESLSSLKKQAIGHYLSDHLSTSIAKISSVKGREKVIQYFGPKFKNGRMRTFRFIDESPSASISNGFYHFIFDQKNLGFNLARKVFQGLQAKKLPVLKSSEVLSGLKGVMNLTYDRYINNKLHISSNTAINLQFDMEQTPLFENKVSLSDEVDIYGRFKSKISWGISSIDYQNVEKATNHFLRKWSLSNLEIELSKSNLNSTSRLDVKLYDTYHPVGTCRIGMDKEAVVDYNLKVHGLTNVYTATTGVFPSSGTANPTFSLLCLVEQLGQYLMNKD